MVETYGQDKTLGELRLQREEWCKTRGRNGRFYSPLNMGWVDRADAALSGNGKQADPPEPEHHPPPIFTAAVPIPADLPRPNIRKDSHAPG